MLEKICTAVVRTCARVDAWLDAYDAPRKARKNAPAPPLPGTEEKT